MSRTVVIGGVGPTTGESLTLRFAEEGDQLALWARSKEFTTRLVVERRAETPGDASAVQVDVTEPDTVIEVVLDLAKDGGSELLN